MPHLDDDRVTLHVAAPPAAVSALIGDVTRTLEFGDGTVVRHFATTPEGGGTRLTGRDEVTGPPSRLGRVGRFVVDHLRRRDRAAERRQDLHATLERVRATAEAVTPRRRERRERRGADRWPRLLEEPRRGRPRRAGPRAVISGGVIAGG
jgi:hypothetical protein